MYSTGWTLDNSYPIFSDPTRPCFVTPANVQA